MRFAALAAATAAALLGLESLDRTDGCTTVAVSRGAVLGGAAALTMHTVDCSECDMRLALVPARDHAPGALHAVMGVGAIFPRHSSSRAAIYQNVSADERVEPVAHIPEAAHTYALWESTYALANEEGLTMGESSCGTVIPGPGLDQLDPSTGELGTAMFSIAALMRLGLERCATARCAIETMGALAEARGFYGEALMEGEALSIADAQTGEAWIFHIVQDFSTNASAVWAAQRVPEGHAAVVANEFTIQEMPELPTDGFLFSGNMRSEAVKAGLYSGAGPFSFQRVFGPKKRSDLYATIRQHSLYSRLAPSLNLPLPLTPEAFDFSYPVDAPLGLQDYIQLFRTHYEGTEADMTKGILSGPFGNPKRVEGGAGKIDGQFARGLSIPRTSYMHVGFAAAAAAATATTTATAGGALPAACFFAPDEPGSAVLAPFLLSTLKEASARSDEEVADSAALYSTFYQVGRRDRFSRDSAWWAFDIVANLMNINFANMSAEVVDPAVQEWQTAAMTAHRAASGGVGPGSSTSSTSSTAIARDFQDRLVGAWWRLFELLIVRYNDGTYNYFEGASRQVPYASFGYPAAWLADIGYSMDFWRARTVQDQIQERCGQITDQLFAMKEAPPCLDGAKVQRAFEIFVDEAVDQASKGGLFIGLVLGFATERIRATIFARVQAHAQRSRLQLPKK